GLVRTGNHKQDESCVVDDWRGHGDAVRKDFADPVAHHEAAIIPQSLGAGKEGKRVAFAAHAEKDKVEARALAGGEAELGAQILLILECSSLGVRIFRVDAMDL